MVVDIADIFLGFTAYMSISAVFTQLISIRSTFIVKGEGGKERGSGILGEGGDIPLF